jgi:hypothetical protein
MREHERESLTEREWENLEAVKINYDWRKRQNGETNSSKEKRNVWEQRRWG